MTVIKGILAKQLLHCHLDVMYIDAPLSVFDNLNYLGGMKEY